MNWHLVLQYAVSGAIVSWPPVLAGYWLTWRKARAHVERQTAAQTQLFEQITTRQTADLLAARPAGYHVHERDSPNPGSPAS